MKTSHLLLVLFAALIIGGSLYIRKEINQRDSQIKALHQEVVPLAYSVPYTEDLDNTAPIETVVEGEIWEHAPMVIKKVDVIRPESRYTLDIDILSDNPDFISFDADGDGSDLFINQNKKIRTVEINANTFIQICVPFAKTSDPQIITLGEAIPILENRIHTDGNSFNADDYYVDITNNVITSLTESCLP